MGLSYYDVERKPRTFLAKLWMILNAIIALGMAFYWSGLALYVAEPFRWAMRDGVSSFPTLFEFPYLLLWSTPLIAMASGWVALKVRQDSVARIIGSYPSMMLALMVGFYNLAPAHWL